MRLIAKNAETSINDSGQLLNIIRRAIDTPDSRVSRVQVNGSPTMTSQGVSINSLSQTELQDAIEAWLNPEFLNNANAGPKVVPANTSVTVLNGSGRSLVGEDMADLLRGKGYKALSGGNADNFGYTSSAILYDEKSQKSLAAARALRLLVGPARQSPPPARAGSPARTPWWWWAGTSPASSTRHRRRPSRTRRTPSARRAWCPSSRTSPAPRG